MSSDKTEETKTNDMIKEFKQAGVKKVVKHPCVVIKSEAAIQELRNRRVPKPVEKMSFRSHQSQGTFAGAATPKNKNAARSVKNIDQFVNNVDERTKEAKLKERPKSFFSCSQSNNLKRVMSWNRKRDFYKPEGKTYKSRHGPKEVDMNDPKWKEKLGNWHRRDTKSGGLSWSSRVRLDARRIRLGSDRFSRPRSDRIYSCSED